ncbi:hypothetical protein SAMN05216215_1014164 [Saccharopolyspora shandongensis]|uniref:Uncharacterized protein n=1 Tax=Saccharopolyspora shandongensis TaxID=418495 RepID=A0A1H3EA41_9PSEU|nr:hypothetical protein [Saccharopolyspora shandongensis]SDX75613.1 hypothetical protein SAMN05216215_1014164 [Saccharopolyspora shandongensis]
MGTTTALVHFATAMAIGLLLGLEREHSTAGQPRRPAAGPARHRGRSRDRAGVVTRRRWNLPAVRVSHEHIANERKVIMAATRIGPPHGARLFGRRRPHVATVEPGAP